MCTCIGYIREQERPHCFEKLLSLSFRIIIERVPKVSRSFVPLEFSGKHFVKFTNESCDELSIGRGQVMSSGKCIHNVNAMFVWHSFKMSLTLSNALKDVPNIASDVLSIVIFSIRLWYIYFIIFA